MIKKYLIALLGDRLSLKLHKIKSRLSYVVRFFSKPLSEKELSKALYDIGIIEGDTVYLHTAMSKIGHLRNGPDTIINLLMGIVKESGTIGAPAHLPPRLVFDKIKDKAILDLRYENIITGSIAKNIKGRQASFCSSHPFASSCFLGKHAKIITSEHQSSSFVCDKKSPMGKLLGLNGKIIGMGIDFSAIVFYHIIEDLIENFPIQVYDKPRMIEYIDNSGKKIKRKISTYNKEVSKTRVEKIGGKNSRKILLHYLLKNNAIVFFKFGRADSWLLKTNLVYISLVSMLNDGFTIYTDKSLSDGVK